MVTRGTYVAAAVTACESVLIELVHIMGEFRGHMVVVGGWVPSLLFRDAKERHAGTLDIDLALDFRRIPAATYGTLVRTFVRRGYRQDAEQPFRFFREVPLSGRDPVVVEVDLLAGEYGGTDDRHRTQAVQDARAKHAAPIWRSMSPCPWSWRGSCPAAGVTASPCGSPAWSRGW